MPIYAFRCDACGGEFERLQKMSDPDPRICPHCGEKTVRRRVTAPAFRLAGSGWYETDFKSDKERKRNLAGKEEPASAVADKKTDGKGDGAGKTTGGGEKTSAATGSAPSRPAGKAAGAAGD